MYLVMGDFNLDLEGWRKESDEILMGWELYPKESRPARDLRCRSIDYILLKASDNMHLGDVGTQAFSPLPLKITGAGDDRTYCFSTKDGHHRTNEPTFTTLDLKSKRIRNHAPLHRNLPSNFALTDTEHFETHEELLKIGGIRNMLLTTISFITLHASILQSVVRADDC